jgi:hypothetical protein
VAGRCNCSEHSPSSEEGCLPSLFLLLETGIECVNACRAVRHSRAFYQEFDVHTIRYPKGRDQANCDEFAGAHILFNSPVTVVVSLSCHEKIVYGGQSTGRQAAVTNAGTLRKRLSWVHCSGVFSSAMQSNRVRARSLYSAFRHPHAPLLVSNYSLSRVVHRFLRVVLRIRYRHPNPAILHSQL